MVASSRGPGSNRRGARVSRGWTLGALLVAAALGTGAVTVVRAQDKPDEPDSSKDEAPETQMAKQIVEFLKDELDLTTEQTDKVRTTIKDAFKNAIKTMMKRMGEDPPPTQEEMEQDQKNIQEKIQNDIRSILDEGQKKEFDALAKEYDSRSGRWERGRGRIGGDAAVWLEGDQPSADRLLAHADKALVLTDEEHKVVFPRLEAAVAARIALRDARAQRRKDMGQAIHAGAREDEVKERLHEFRRKDVELQLTLEKAEEQVREIVTVEQEARLVAIGILD